MPRRLNLLLFLLLALHGVGQTPKGSKYRIELLSMIRSDSTHGSNDVQASLLMTPIDTKEWPPVLSMRVGVRFNEQTEFDYIDIQHHDPQVVRLTVYDKATIAEKNPKLYARVRSKLDPMKAEDNMILFFEFRNVHAGAIRKMTFTYGPWEKQDMEKRVEETFSREFPD